MDNVDISFTADKSADEKKRINDMENYLSLLTERVKFCFAGICDDISKKTDGAAERELIFQTLSNGVGQFTNTAQNAEVFNDYENNTASAPYSHAEGTGTKATAPYAHAEGSGTTAAAPGAHAEGNGAVASNSQAHAEGKNTTASGTCSHAEGENTTAGGYNSHAEGYSAVASGGYSHAEGYGTAASGWYSHAGGIDSEAKAEASFAHGDHAISNCNGGAAFGRMNKTKDALFVVGNGWASTNTESDALVLDNAGNLWVAGDIKCGGDSGGYVLPPATADTLGGVKIGENISVADDGTVSVDLSPYLKNTDISDWAKAESKPTYTADEVGAATAADISQAVGDIRIGGRNLATGTADMVIGTGGNASGQWRKSGTGTIETIDITDAPCNVHKGVRLTLITNNHQMGVVQDKILINSDSVYTLSCWVRSNSEDGVICRLQPFYKTADHGGAGDFVVKNSWQKISFTAIRPPQTTAEYSGAYVYLQPNDIGSYLDICGIQLESGNKATDWSPAPEDDERKIASLEARVAALEAVLVSGGEV